MRPSWECLLKPGRSALPALPKDIQGRGAPEPQTLALRPSPLSVALLAACLWPLSFLGPRQARKMGLGKWPRLDKALGLPGCSRLPDVVCQGMSGTMKHPPPLVSPHTVHSLTSYKANRLPFKENLGERCPLPLLCCHQNQGIPSSPVSSAPPLLIPSPQGLTTGRELVLEWNPGQNSGSMRSCTASLLTMQTCMCVGGVG